MFCVSRRTRLWSVLLLLTLFSTFALAQRMKPADRSEDADEDTDRAAERLMWFLEGRLTPDGRPPAEKAQKAHERRMQMRAEQEKLRLMKSADPNATVPVGSATSPWTPIGPATILNDGLWGQVSGRIAAVTVDQSDATGNTVLLGGAFGGVWRSVNAASADSTQITWSPLIDAQATLAVGAISLKPDNHNVILVGTGEAKSAIDSYYGRGILRSTDGGTNWTQITQTAEAVQFLGLGFARFAWSTANTNIVVAATTSTAIGNRTGAVILQGSNSGLFYSTDAGATWHKASVTDSGSPVSAAAHSVVYNAAAGKFYAAIRFHGIYESTDGQNFTRIANQPDSANVTLANCPTAGNSSCPFYRGELAVVPGRNEMYLWYTQANSDTIAGNRGAFYTLDGGANWRTLTMSGMNTCGDSQGCGASQGYFYNMAIAAVPVLGTQTDLYLGAVNVFKCRINPADASSLCNSASEPNKFMNLTHVYGNQSTCGWGGMAIFHPDNHSYDFSQSNPAIVYFGNDGGIYRTLTSQSITTGVCTTTKQPFQDLNNASLSLTQFVWGSPHPTDSTQFMGGAQDNGTSMTYNAIKGANGQMWKPILSGDGGYNAIRSDSPSTLIASYVNANMYICALGTNCDENGFTQFIAPANLTASGAATQDSSPFYTVWELDKRLPSKMVIGTCRIWRVNSSSPFSGTAISPKLNNASGQAHCTSGDYQIYAVATGGPAGTGGVATVIYAGLSNGAIWRTSNADAASPTWNDVTPPTSLNPGPLWGPPGFRISSIAIDPNDATGNTAYATIQGFSTPHVLKTVNGGTSWTDFTGNLPDAPANSVTVDPDDSTVVYVGNDIGVFATGNGGTTWVEVGIPGSTASYLPNVVVNRVVINKIGSTRTLYAVTYGRGVWKTDLTSAASGPALSFDVSPVNFPNTVVNTDSSTLTITLSNNGSATLDITNIAASGLAANGFVDVGGTCADAAPTSINAGASCTQIYKFHPTSSGAKTGTLTFTDNAANSPQVLTFNGTGAAPQANFSSTTLAFGGQPITTSASKTVTITNGGNFPLSITNISLPGPGGYLVATNCPLAPNQTLGFAAPNNTCTITVNFTPATTGAKNTSFQVTHDATGSPVTVNLTGTGEDFAAPSFVATTVTVAKGATANFGTVTIAPSGGSFTNAITFSCSGLPSGANCAFNPATVTPGAVNGTTQMTITTTPASSASTVANSTTSHKPLFAFWLALPGMAFLLPAVAARRKRKWLVTLTLITLCLLMLISMTACGSGNSSSSTPKNPGTPAGTYTVGVSAASGGLTRSTNVTLTVQ